MNALESTDTATFKTRLAIMVECDFREERGEGLAEVALIRLQNQSDKSPDDLTMIGVLQKELQISSDKRVGVHDARKRFIGQVYFTEPLGPYYTHATMTYRQYIQPEVRKLCDEQPIEYLEISEIPGDVKPETLRSHLIGRVNRLTLHFGTTGQAVIWSLLPQLGLRGTVELRNVNTPQAALDTLGKRLGITLISGDKT